MIQVTTMNQTKLQISNSQVNQKKVPHQVSQSECGLQVNRKEVPQPISNE